MADEPAPDAPEGAAVFPLIPEELGVHPLLLGVLHAYVFLEGSEPTVLHPSAAEEAMQYLVTYIQRLGGAELRRVKRGLQTLIAACPGRGELECCPIVAALSGAQAPGEDR